MSSVFYKAAVYCTGCNKIHGLLIEKERICGAVQEIEAAMQADRDMVKKGHYNMNGYCESIARKRTAIFDGRPHSNNHVKVHSLEDVTGNHIPWSKLGHSSIPYLKIETDSFRLRDREQVRIRYVDGSGNKVEGTRIAHTEHRRDRQGRMSFSYSIQESRHLVSELQRQQQQQGQQQGQSYRPTRRTSQPPPPPPPSSSSSSASSSTSSFSPVSPISPTSPPVRRPPGYPSPYHANTFPPLPGSPSSTSNSYFPTIPEQSPSDSRSVMRYQQPSAPVPVSGTPSNRIQQHPYGAQQRICPPPITTTTPRSRRMSSVF